MSEPFVMFRGLDAFLDGIPLTRHLHGSRIRLLRMCRASMGLQPRPLLCLSSVMPRSVILRRLFKPTL